MLTFISIRFYFLLAAIIILYFIIPLKYRWLVLLAGSLTFYCFQGIEMLPLLAGAALIGWGFSLWMDKIYVKAIPKTANGGQQKKKTKLLCGIALVVIIGVLALVKFARFLPEVLAVRLFVPVGISYYTFSVVAYLIDVYRKKYKPERNFFKFLLFVVFFPKILQGPIARYERLAPQLYEGHRFDYNRMCIGIQLLIWGLFKKLVIADRLNIFTSTVFDGAVKNAGSVLLVAAVLAVFELYCDFSGCMDMASGMSHILGIELEQNFDHPFFSKSAAEFWRRWHITLGAWFKDYVYMPIVTSPRMSKLLQWTKKHFGTRAGKSVMVIIPLGIVWILTGLWHGTGKAYVVWGVYWGILIILSQIFAQEIKKLNTLLHINTKAVSFQIFQMVRTFGLFTIGRIITIPNNLSVSLDIMKKMFLDFEPWKLLDGTLYTYGLDQKNFSLIPILLVLLWCVSMLQKRGSLREQIAGYNIVFRWAIYYIAIVAIIVLGIYGPGYDASSFIYMAY